MFLQKELTKSGRKPGHLHTCSLMPALAWKALNEKLVPPGCDDSAGYWKWADRQCCRKKNWKKRRSRRRCYGFFCTNKVFFENTQVAVQKGLILCPNNKFYLMFQNLFDALDASTGIFLFYVILNILWFKRSQGQITFFNNDFYSCWVMRLVILHH